MFPQMVVPTFSWGKGHTGASLLDGALLWDGSQGKQQLPQVHLATAEVRSAVALSALRLSMRARYMFLSVRWGALEPSARMFKPR